MTSHSNSDDTRRPAQPEENNAARKVDRRRLIRSAVASVPVVLTVAAGRARADENDNNISPEGSY